MLTEMTKLIVAFRNFANAPKNESLFCTCVCITFRCDKYSTVQVHAGYQQVFSNNAALEQKTRTDNLQQQCSVTTNDTHGQSSATMQRYNKRHALDNLQQQCSVTTNDTHGQSSNNAALQQTTRTDNLQVHFSIFPLRSNRNVI